MKERERVPFSNEPYGPTPKKPVARLAIALVAMIGLIVWLRSPSDPKTSALLLGSGSASASASASASGPASPASRPLLIVDGGTLHDRKARDELRRRMIVAWSAAEIEADKGRLANAPNQAIPPMPTGADGKIDPEYIRDVVRSDLKPLIEKCFEEIRTRKPDAEGRFSMSFKIVGDSQIGGIVDETKLAEDAGALAADDSFTTCVRESTMTLAFRPPPIELGTRGEVVVPLTLVLRAPTQEKK